jgi:hypothetical protein
MLVSALIREWPDWGYLYSTYTVYPQVTNELAIDDP